MKTFKSYQNRLPETLTAVLKNSELVIHAEPAKKKSKSSSKNHLSPGKEIQQLLSYQIDEINKLKREKVSLENHVIELENQVKRLSLLPAVLKEKEKIIHRLKKDVKKTKGSKEKGGSCKGKLSHSLRNTPKIRAESIFADGSSTTRHQSSRTHISLPSNRNSGNDFSALNLHDILMKTENVLNGWEKQCGRKKHII
jgi:hypothetical protein